MAESTAVAFGIGFVSGMVVLAVTIVFVEAWRSVRESARDRLQANTHFLRPTKQWGQQTQAKAQNEPK